MPEPIASDSTESGWDPREIDARLPYGAKSRIARRFGVSISSVIRVVRRRARSRRIEGAIASYLGVPAVELFGEAKFRRPIPPSPAPPPPEEAA